MASTTANYRAKTRDAFEPAKQTAEQMTERTQEAIANYFSWLQNAMQASPWGNTDLNKQFMSYAIEIVIASTLFCAETQPNQEFGRSSQNPN